MRFAISQVPHLGGQNLGWYWEGYDFISNSIYINNISLISIIIVSSECPDGTYGTSCTGVCHCHGGVSCNKTMGQCPTKECDAGWSVGSIPYVCSTGKYLMYLKMDHW